MTGKPRAFTDEQLRAALASGSIGEAAAALGVRDTCIYLHMRRLGLPLEHPKNSKANKRPCNSLLPAVAPCQPRRESLRSAFAQPLPISSTFRTMLERGGQASRRPLIALNADVRTSPSGGPGVACVVESYYNRLTEVGARTLILPPVADVEALTATLGLVDGVVLTGGGDLDPHNDGYRRHATTQLMDRRRERFDRMLAVAVRDTQKPVLAIGAGAQLLAVTCGGTLFYHLPAEKPNGLAHCDPDGQWNRHSLQFAPNSLLAAVYDTESTEVLVSSRHHQAIDDVPMGFVATAWAPDGVIEAIESTDPAWLAAGVQWHPECPAATRMDAGIFETWIEHVQAHKLEK